MNAVLQGEGKRERLKCGLPKVFFTLSVGFRRISYVIIYEIVLVKVLAAQSNFTLLMLDEPLLIAEGGSMRLAQGLCPSG